MPLRVLHRSVLLHSGVSSSPSWFAAQRAKVLSDLQTSRNDRSLAGGVDPRIVPLVTALNASPLFCTLSSCSGRIVLFHRKQFLSGGGSGGPPSSPPHRSDPRKVQKKRGSGMGSVFQSHDPCTDAPLMSVEARVDAITAGIAAARVTMAAKEEATEEETAAGTLAHPPSVQLEVLQLKFEPMIVHVMCSSLASAQRLMAAATESGQSRSGLVGFRPVGLQQAVPDSGRPAEAEGGNGAGESDAAAQAEAAECAGRKITLSMTSTLNMDIPLCTAIHRSGVPYPDASWAASAADAERALIRHAVMTSEVLFHENFRRTEAILQRVLRATGSGL